MDKRLKTALLLLVLPVAVATYYFPEMVGFIVLTILFLQGLSLLIAYLVDNSFNSPPVPDKSTRRPMEQGYQPVVIKEGTEKKGGVNTFPKTAPPPTPPKGQSGEIRPVCEEGINYFGAGIKDELKPSKEKK